MLIIVLEPSVVKSSYFTSDFLQILRSYMQYAVFKAFGWATFDNKTTNANVYEIKLSESVCQKNVGSRVLAKIFI